MNTTRALSAVAFGSTSVVGATISDDWQPPSTNNMKSVPSKRENVENGIETSLWLKWKSRGNCAAAGIQANRRG
ncbi:hypothetical protein [Phytopseudomonas argentinensis]|uniref:hypothetical protein n=1 Tax=Phytopseudomonas argentinensis TaxID=289370 RepID=UPI001FCA32F9|nr:hypothetical protein [Pseudomonas argentinensis]